MKILQSVKVSAVVVALINEIQQSFHILNVHFCQELQNVPPPFCTTLRTGKFLPKIKVDYRTQGISNYFPVFE